MPDLPLVHVQWIYRQLLWGEPAAHCRAMNIFIIFNDTNKSWPAGRKPSVGFWIPFVTGHTFIKCILEDPRFFNSRSVFSFENERECALLHSQTPQMPRSEELNPGLFHGCCLPGCVPAGTWTRSRSGTWTQALWDGTAVCQVADLTTVSQCLSPAEQLESKRTSRIYGKMQLKIHLFWCKF